MSNFSKIVLIIVLLLTFFFIKEKISFNFDIADSFSKLIKQFEIFQKDNEEKLQIPPDDTQEKQVQTVNVYFLTLNSNADSVYKKVTRELPADKNKLDYAIKELLKGPNFVEKKSGAYSEIPKTTKLLGIKETDKKVVIDFSSDFQYGGGTDSVYSRTMQLIKTSVDNANNKEIYLYLDGKQIKFLGGEGIMISQPLNEKSLEN